MGAGPNPAGRRREPDPAAAALRSGLARAFSRLFGPLDDSEVQSLGAAVSSIRLDAGEVLMRQGEPGDALFAVMSGRLRAFTRGTDGSLRRLNDIGAGELIGEVALVTGGRRTATVVVVRDAHLARLDRRQFEVFADSHPKALLGVARTIGERLQRLTGEVAATQAGVAKVAPPATIALVGVDAAAPLDEFAEQLAAALRTWASPVVVRPPLDGHSPEVVPGWLGRLLDQLEGAGRLPILVANDGTTPWAERAMRHADEVVLVAGPRSTPSSGGVADILAALRVEPQAGPRVTLLRLHPPEHREPAGTAAWLAWSRADRHLHVRIGDMGHVARVARFLVGRAVGLALGGGGVRGFAHVGVIQSCEELGIPIDSVGGTSMGAVIAAAVAAGWDSEEILRWFRGRFGSLLDPTLPVTALLSGGRIWRAIRAGFGSRQIEDLWLPFLAVSTNLTTAERIVDRLGPVAMAVRSSISIPGVLPPVPRGGDLVVDGGLVDDVPVELVRASIGQGPLIAVDVSDAAALRAAGMRRPYVSGWAIARDRLMRRRAARVPSIIEIMNRSAVLGGHYVRGRLGTDTGADLYLNVPSERVGLLDFRHVDTVADAGYRRSRELLRAWWEEQSGRPAGAAQPGEGRPGDDRQAN